MDLLAFEVGFYLTGFLEQHWCLGPDRGDRDLLAQLRQSLDVKNPQNQAWLDEVGR